MPNGTYSLALPTDGNSSYASSFSNYGMGDYNNFMPSGSPDIATRQWLSENNMDILGRPIAPQSFADMTGLQKLTAGMSLAGNLANIWSGLQQNRLARDNFNLQKGVLNTNLANQISSYNTALEDKVAGRYSDRERAAKQPEINDYLDRNRAVNRMG